MKKTLMERRTEIGYLYGGLLSIIVNLFLASSALTPPADTAIDFLSNHSGSSEIYPMPPNGKQLRRFTKYPELDSASTWSLEKKQSASSAV